jgi:hypothetical protein
VRSVEQIASELIAALRSPQPNTVTGSAGDVAAGAGGVLASPGEEHLFFKTAEGGFVIAKFFEKLPEDFKLRLPEFSDFEFVPRSGHATPSDPTTKSHSVDHGVDAHALLGGVGVGHGATSTGGGAPSNRSVIELIAEADAMPATLADFILAERKSQTL